MENIINLHTKKMDDVIKKLEIELSKLKTNLANPNILANIQVDYFGSRCPISQISHISVRNGNEIIVKPYDKNTMHLINAAISKSDLELNVQNTGDVLSIMIPPLTGEIRKDIVKKMHKIIETYKIGIRNIRRNANNQIKKDDSISKNQERDLEEKIQKLTILKTNLILEMAKQKEKQIMTL